MGEGKTKRVGDDGRERLPPGWTQWRKERPDGRLCDLFVSPDGSFETDLMQSNGNGKGKIGVYDYMADQQ